jgi:hypothetical protein
MPECLSQAPFLYGNLGSGELWRRWNYRSLLECSCNDVILISFQEMLRNLIVPPAFRLGFMQSFKPAAIKSNMCDLSNYGTCFLILFAFSTRSCLVSMSTQIKSNKKSTVSKAQQQTRVWRTWN